MRSLNVVRAMKVFLVAQRTFRDAVDQGKPRWEIMANCRAMCDAAFRLGEAERAEKKLPSTLKRQF